MDGKHVNSVEYQLTVLLILFHDISGQTGVDPYTTAVSDVYQICFEKVFLPERAFMILKYSTRV